MKAADLLKAKTPRTEAFDKACEARGIGFRGHYEELKRRLESNEPLPIAPQRWRVYFRAAEKNFADVV